MKKNPAPFLTRPHLLQRVIKALPLWVASVTVLLWILFPKFAYAQTTMPANQTLSQPMLIFFSLGALALLPIAMIMMTSFVKIVVVLSLVRNALGTQQIPPNQVITGLAIILTIYIMGPVAQQVYTQIQGIIYQSSSEGMMSAATVQMGKEAIEKGKEPVREFLIKNTDPIERGTFHRLAMQLHAPKDVESVTDKDFLVLVPAFIVSELAEAFKIGFILFLPFLVVDMVVANILLALGMFQLSPVTVSLPFKLLLFVLVNGWDRIAKALVDTYQG